MKTTHTFTREEVEEMLRSWCSIPKEDEIIIDTFKEFKQSLQTARVQIENGVVL